MRRRLSHLIKIILSLTIILVFFYLINLGSQFNDSFLKSNVNLLTRSGKWKNLEHSIHIGVVIIDYIFCVDFHTVLKSILFYRKNPLHFHIIVDQKSKTILKTLFETWILEEVIVTFYDGKNISVQGLENFELNEQTLKFILPKLVLKNNIKKLIVIENDKIILDNVYKLWTLIDNFSEKQSIGKVHIEEVDGSIYRLLKGNEIVLFKNINDTTLQTDEDIQTNIENPNMTYTVLCPRNDDIRNCYDSENNLVLMWNDFYPSKNHNHTFFDHFDGALLRRNYKKDQIDKNQYLKTLSSNNCTEFFSTMRHVWRTLVFVRKFDYGFKGTDVSIVSQLSFSRISLIEKVANVWDGPMSLTVYLSDSELGIFRNFIDRSNVLKNRFNIAYHVVFKEHLSYPINVLRNNALNNTVTPYVFLVDIDFIPSKNLYIYLKSFLATVADTEKKAFIVPAFETSHLIPSTKEELLHLLNNRTISLFHRKSYKLAHSPTNLLKWKVTKEPYQVEWKHEFEPYVVVKRTVPIYDTRFFGYGWNKVSHIMELAIQGYLFIVLPDGFIVHLNHKWTSEKRELISSAKYRTCLDIVKKSFVLELMTKYGSPKKK